MKFLLEICQQEKDWMKAVGVALELEKDSGQSAQKEIANYYCELALSETTHSRPEGAKRHLEAALPRTANACAPTSSWATSRRPRATTTAPSRSGNGSNRRTPPTSRS